MIFPTPAAELAELAAECIGFERDALARGFKPSSTQAATRDMLADHARDLGIAPTEIEAAVEAAIRTASTKEPATT